jgi:hypothetical protein
MPERLGPAELARLVGLPGGAQPQINRTMKLTGVGTRFGKSTVAPMTGCRRLRPADELSLRGVAVRDILAQRPVTTR